jgi:hypothetical protein
MANLLSARGCVYHVETESKSTGFYTIPGLDHGSESSNKQTPILIHGVKFTDNDIFSASTTLSGKKIIYTFGEGIGSVSVVGELLLGPAGGSPDNLKALINFFQENRSSKKSEPTAISMPGGTGINVYFTALDVAAPDPQTHTQLFQIRAIPASLKKSDR